MDINSAPALRNSDEAERPASGNNVIPFPRDWQASCDELPIWWDAEQVENYIASRQRAVENTARRAAEEHYRCGAGMSADHSADCLAFAVSAEALFANGYGPVPETGSQRIPFKGWTTFYPDTPRTPEDIHELVEEYPDASLGVACGYNDLASIDIDTDEADKLGTIVNVLPICCIAKRGSKGRTLFFRFAGDPADMCNRRFYGKKADGSKSDAPFCEVLWQGRKTTIPPTIHVKTGRPYEWLDPEHTLFNTPVTELPALTIKDLDALGDAIRPWLWEPPPPEETAKVFNRTPTNVEEKRFRGVARSILDRLAGELKGMKEGGRNYALYCAGCVIGKYVHHGHIDESDVIAAFAGASNHSGLERDSGKHGVLATIRSGLKAGASFPLRELIDRPRTTGAKKGASVKVTPAQKALADRYIAPDGADPKLREREEAFDATVASLASISETACHLSLKDEAGKLKVTPTFLRKKVEEARTKAGDETDADAGETIEPWPEAVDGKALLTDLTTTFRNYMVMSEPEITASSLWTIHTHAHDAFIISPYLAAVSPIPGCGKTTLLSVLQEVSANALSVASITAAAVYRSISQWKPTLLLDECDKYFNSREDLQGIINSAHNKRLAFAVVCVEVKKKQVATKFSTWTPIALAWKGENLPDTIDDRSIPIRLRKKMPSDRIKRFRADKVDELQTIARKCARWAADNLEALRKADASVPHEITNDRRADNWRTLLAIAEVIGGDWPEKARKAALAIEGAGATLPPALSVLLLADVREVFGEYEAELSARVIIERIVVLDERPWLSYEKTGRQITEHAFARLLGTFEISSKKRTFGPDKAKMFWRKDDFEDSWGRYLPPLEFEDDVAALEDIAAEAAKAAEVAVRAAKEAKRRAETAKAAKAAKAKASAEAKAARCDDDGCSDYDE